MHIGLFNAWLLVLPMVVIFAYVAVFHRDAARRMGDMSGYTTREKAFAVSASLSPYLFMVLTIFTPFTSNMTALCTGALFYMIALVGFLLAVITYTKARPNEPVSQGIYRISRNPMYVTALLMFAGITIMTLNAILAILLVTITVLHHGMIRAEEQACTRRFGTSYERYRESTPRYLLIRSGAEPRISDKESAR